MKSILNLSMAADLIILVIFCNGDFLQWFTLPFRPRQAPSSLGTVIAQTVIVRAAQADMIQAVPGSTSRPGPVRTMRLHVAFI
jgi:hypothetical protein